MTLKNQFNSTQPYQVLIRPYTHKKILKGKQQHKTPPNRSIKQQFRIDIVRSIEESCVVNRCTASQLQCLHLCNHATSQSLKSSINSPHTDKESTALKGYGYGLCSNHLRATRVPRAKDFPTNNQRDKDQARHKILKGKRNAYSLWIIFVSKIFCLFKWICVWNVKYMHLYLNILWYISLQKDHVRVAREW